MDKIEVKAALSVSDDGTITGNAWPFGTPDRVGDMIQPGAFRKAAAPIPMLFAHDPKDVVGVWETIGEDGRGLQVKGRFLIDDVARAREVRAMVKAGAIGGLSIGFITRKAAATVRGRSISDLDLFEISLVSVPSHPRARVTSVKSGARAISLAAAISRAAAALRS